MILERGTAGGTAGGKQEDRLNDGNNNGQLRIANATSGGARKAAWAKIKIKMLKVKRMHRTVRIRRVSCCFSVSCKIFTVGED